MRRISKLISGVWLAVACLLSSCSGGPLFIPIGDNVGGPIAIAIDPAALRAYLVNSDFNVEFTEGSLMVLDLTDPTAPVLLDISGNPVIIDRLSGPIHFDAATSQVFITNRFAKERGRDDDRLFRISIDEGGDFGSLDEFDAGIDPFGLVCCDAADNLLIAAFGTLEALPRTDPASSTSLSLELTLSTNAFLSGELTTRVTILGSQAFLTNRTGVIYVINLDELGVADANPIDYLLTGMGDLRGIATDGTNLFVAEIVFQDADEPAEDEQPSVIRVIDPSALPPIAPDTSEVPEVNVEDPLVNLASDPFVTTVDIGQDANEVLIFGTKLYVTNTRDNSVSVLDISNPASLTVTNTIDLSGDDCEGPFGLAAASVAGKDLLYVTCLDSNNVMVIDLGINSVAGTFP